MSQLTTSTQFLYSGASPVDGKMQAEDEDYIKALIMNNQHWKGMTIINIETDKQYVCVSKLYTIPSEIDSADWILLFDKDWIIQDVGSIDGGEY